MLVTLTITRYPRRYIPFAVLSMALFRIPLWLNRDISFFKLMGCGKNGSFDKNPDWQQWAIMAVHKNLEAGQLPSNDTALHTMFKKFIPGWLRLFKCETWSIFLLPVQCHGTWDKKMPFLTSGSNTAVTGPVAVLTRATIRLSKLKAFWSNVDAVAGTMAAADGFVTSVGIGEIPYIRQATFSIWQNAAAMKAFAYSMPRHREVIQKTRSEAWYSEEMFARFVPLQTFGSINGQNPFPAKA
ncbi:MAG TPA: spheroidene monooxygenase [Ferruginibacter sp.]|nr:spheroidene monooxygenase [Ferruginibacter sp.]HMP22029.1 spheroidene monooxygenase [Ferruginibacter sp.]